MAQMTARRRRTSRGVALVEFAIVIPLLLCLLLGVITGGQAVYTRNNLTDAAREGARFGATLGDAIPDETTWRAAVVARIQSLDPDIETICVELVRVSGAANTECGVNDPPNSLDQWVVKVRTTGSAKLEAFFFSRPISLQAGVAVRYERVEL